MRFGNLPLLLLLVEEYSNLIDDISTSLTVKSRSVLNKGLYISKIYDIDDDEDEVEVEDRLEDLEDEILVMMLYEKRKSEKDTNVRKKRQKYNHTDKKLFFTNPETNKRQIFTFENSIWYLNYVCYPRVDNPS